MILKFIDTPLDGKSWEKLMNSCYRMKFQDEHFTEIPAVYGGDAGIEGFTRKGRVYQCYCPERGYTDDDLHGHLRDKMTKDIGKLTTPKYADRLRGLGVPAIKEWHFVIPEYKDSRIISHAETKRKEVIALKNADPSNYDYIDDDFIIVIKQAEDFKVEISRMIRTTLTDMQLNIAIHHTTAAPNWSQCESEKVNNIKRKVKAVMGDVDESDEDYIDLVNMYINSYINGIEIMKVLRVSYSEVYEEIFILEQSYKKQVSFKTRMNTNSSINAQLFNEILDDFQKKLEQFKYLNMASIMELKIDLISGWLADCSMQFRSR
ncbi:hypothetical protein BK120_23255 [Paenibacillus sp. FSL A5-0031]|uniref:hypothetical protein n=1 Tax=Paenibacillus sp. FSL A5-0031 TaxID=1920420 RepID=UPI00096C5932|nr:hypothetical protein [Paenibacillus sp. FSL A5-0031]OME78660.1 hypothetical protein BK120_23255 [Paenibacillus sp. FSL A5-0031]